MTSAYVSSLMHMEGGHPWTPMQQLAHMIAEIPGVTSVRVWEWENSNHGMIWAYARWEVKRQPIMAALAEFDAKYQCVYNDKQMGGQRRFKLTGVSI